MKRPIKLIVFLMALLGSVQVFGQNKLLLTEIQIRTEEMGNFERFADKQANVASDLPVTITLYKDQYMTYYTCFHMTERGKKYRLVNHDYIVYNGERFKGEKQVLKYKKTEGIRGRIAGVSEQNIVFNKELERSVQMVYRFELVLD